MNLLRCDITAQVAVPFRRESLAAQEHARSLEDKDRDAAERLRAELESFTKQTRITPSPPVVSQPPFGELVSRRTLSDALYITREWGPRWVVIDDPRLHFFLHPATARPPHMLPSPHTSAPFRARPRAWQPMSVPRTVQPPLPSTPSASTSRRDSSSPPRTLSVTARDHSRDTAVQGGDECALVASLALPRAQGLTQSTLMAA